MGQLSFFIPSNAPPEAVAGLSRAHLAGGYDQAPMPGSVTVADNVLTLSSPDFESGYVAVPWPVDGFGLMVTTTATLRGRSEPYHLTVEMARGKINQVRNQTTEWIDIGLQPGPGFIEKLNLVTKRFGPAAVNGGEPDADETATAVLVEAYNLADRLVRTYTEQVFTTRHQQMPRLDTSLGCKLSVVPDAAGAEVFLAAFNAATLVPVWKSVEPSQAQFEWSRFDELMNWAGAAGLRVTVGPILDLNPHSLPEWVNEWAGDLPSLAAFFCDYVESFISRFRGKAGRWLVFTGFNHAEVLGLTEDERLRLAARVIDAARQADPEGDVIIGITDPWGEYKTNPAISYSPLVFADTLLRTGLRLAALDLDLRTNAVEARRDLLDVARLIESFSVLGIPLQVNVSFPIGAVTSLGDSPADETDTSLALQSINLTAIGKLHGLLSLAVGLPQIRNVTWDQWADDAPWGSPGCGMEIDGQARSIAATDVFAGVRQAHLE
ncbi:MAG TPA: endo-1,4-beta-xylanase [Fimbriiglobus sp.]|jgi:hypothetical protein